MGRHIFHLAVAQRMNDFRIPPRSAVRLVFGRKVLRTDHDPEEVRSIPGVCIRHCACCDPRATPLFDDFPAE
jgi:hypothetical protein